MFGTLDTTTSALVAQRTRSEVIAANLANANAIVDENGENNPFRRRMAIFAPGDPSTGSNSGVHVREIALDESEFQYKYMPDHPLAAKDGPHAGYVAYPNISPMMEQVDMMEAARAYEANIAAAEATKSMIQTSLRILA
jgi:flagellar basal-body rod protein FlgC